MARGDPDSSNHERNAGIHERIRAGIVETDVEKTINLKVAGKQACHPAASQRADQTRAPLAPGALPVADLGSWQTSWLRTDASRWQRTSASTSVIHAHLGSEERENTNGLLRQYLSKGLDLPDIPQAKLSVIPRRLNQRPRKTPRYETPAERYRQCVASVS